MASGGGASGANKRSYAFEDIAAGLAQAASEVAQRLLPGEVAAAEIRLPTPTVHYDDRTLIAMLAEASCLFRDLQLVERTVRVVASDPAVNRAGRP